MSGFIKQLLFGDVGNWWHAAKVDDDSIRQRNKIRDNISVIRKSDNDQEKRIIQLEIIAGSLLGIIREKELIDEEELKKILDLAESEANLALHPRKKKYKKYRYHS
ncbi:MAG: hypothetical protein AB8C40_08745 [Gammaproteobacteria bacterium]